MLQCLLMIWYDLVIFTYCLSWVNALFFNLFGRSLPVPRRHTPYFGQPDYRMYELNKRLQQRTEVGAHCICLVDYPSWHIHDQTCFTCITSATKSTHVAEYTYKRTCSALLDDQRSENEGQFHVVNVILTSLSMVLAVRHNDSDLESCLGLECLPLTLCYTVIVEVLYVSILLWIWIH
jgi:hypothetical protein